jgi:hypothetical protein
MKEKTRCGFSPGESGAQWEWDDEETTQQRQGNNIIRQKNPKNQHQGERERGNVKIPFRHYFLHKKTHVEMHIS